MRHVRRRCHVVLSVDELVTLPVVGEVHEVLVGEPDTGAGGICRVAPGHGAHSSPRAEHAPLSSLGVSITPMTTRPAIITALLFALPIATASQAPSTDRATNPGALRQIIPGHYVFTRNNEGRLFNSGVVATSEGVVVFDALDSEAIARAERQAIAGV